MSINQNFPEVSPSLLLDFANSRTLDPRITFTRSSIGTYVASNGLIKTAAADEPRFDHDPETGESLGLLIEESRTNLFTNSAFSQGTTTSLPAYWDAWNPATFLTSQTLSPDGVAYGVFHGAINQNGGGLRKNVTGLTPGGTYYVSYYVKGLTAEELTYFTNNNARGTTTGTADGAANVAWFAATQVEFTCSNLNGTGASGLYKTTLTTEWKRFGGVVIADSAGSARIIIENNVGDVGTGNEDGGGTWMIWGAQLELGSFPTSYIPTSGSTATRAADLPYIEGTSFSNWYNSGGGSYVLDAITYSYSGLLFGFGTSSYLEAFTVSNSGASQFVISGNYNLSNAYTGNINLNQSNKIGVSFNSTGQRACSNGQTVNASVGSTSLFTDFDRLSIGGNIPWDKNYTIQRKTHVKSFSYYPKYLSDAQLQNLTK